MEKKKADSKNAFFWIIVITFLIVNIAAISAAFCLLFCEKVNSASIYTVVCATVIVCCFMICNNVLLCFIIKSLHKKTRKKIENADVKCLHKAYETLLTSENSNTCTKDPQSNTDG